MHSKLSSHAHSIRKPSDCVSWISVALGLLLILQPPPAAILCAQEDDSAKLYQRTAESMGVQFVVKMYAESPEVAEAAAQAAFARVDQLNRCLSDYDPDSELRRLTEEQSPAYDRLVVVSEDLWQVLVFGSEMSRTSRGAVDVTIGPLSRLWRRARRRHELPAADQIAAARQHVDYRAIVFNPSDRSVRLARPQMLLDVGAIAKGFAADCALDVLARHGVPRSLVDAGGDLAIGRAPPEVQGWPIDVTPTGDTSSSVVCLLLSDCGVATSGAVARGAQIGHREYSHIVDPRTGHGLTNRIAVTVVAPSGMMADAYATAASVLGVAGARALIESRSDVHAMLFDTSDDASAVWASPGCDDLSRCRRRPGAR